MRDLIGITWVFYSAKLVEKGREHLSIYNRCPLYGILSVFQFFFRVFSHINAIREGWLLLSFFIPFISYLTGWDLFEKFLFLFSLLSKFSFLSPAHLDPPPYMAPLL